MESHLPTWVIHLFTTANSLTQSIVLIVLLAGMVGLLYGNLRKRLRMKALLAERTSLRNRLQRQELLTGDLRAELLTATARGESLQQEVFTLVRELARLSQDLNRIKETMAERERSPVLLAQAFGPAYPFRDSYQTQSQTSRWSLLAQG
jgi:hypothetical protein